MTTRGCDHKFVDSKHCLKCGWIPPPTSKQLAEAIARAVIKRWDSTTEFRRDEIEPSIQVVMDTLDQHGCWFCEKRETDQGTEDVKLLPFHDEAK